MERERLFLIDVFVKAEGRINNWGEYKKKEKERKIENGIEWSK